MNDFNVFGINQLKNKSFVKAREKLLKLSKELINLHDITIPKTQKKYLANHLYLINIRKELVY